VIRLRLQRIFIVDVWKFVEGIGCALNLLRGETPERFVFY
jgi:hypothetical protein